EEHVNFQLRIDDRVGVKPPQLGQRIAGIEQAGIEEIRTLASGFEGEFAKAQDIQPQGKFDEITLITFHATHAAHQPRAFCCNWNSSFRPFSARSIMASISPRLNGSPSAVPCTSTRPPCWVMITFMSVSAPESSG